MRTVSVIGLGLLVLLGSVSCQRARQTAPRASGDPRAYLLEYLHSPVMSVAVTPDGKTVAAGCFDGSIRTWDLATGEPGAAFQAHSEVVTSLAVTPDGATVISGSRDKTVKLWELGTGKEIKTLAGHIAGVTALSLSKDGKLLASVGPYDLPNRPAPGDVCVWELPAGDKKELGDLPQKIAGATCVAVTPDGDAVVIGSTDGRATVWGLEEPKAIKTFAGHRDMMWAMALNSDGKMLVTGDSEGTVKLWDASTAKELQSFDVAPRNMVRVALDPSGQILATAADDRFVSFWDVATGQKLASAQDQDNYPLSLVFTPDGKKLVCGRGQFTGRGPFNPQSRPLVGDVKVWDVDAMLERDKKAPAANQE